MPINRFQASLHCINRLETNDPLRLEAARYIRDRVQIVNGRAQGNLRIRMPISTIFSTILTLSEDSDEKLEAAQVLLTLRSYARGEVLDAAKYVLEHVSYGSTEYDLASQCLVVHDDSSSDMVIQATKYLYATSVEGVVDPEPIDSDAPMVESTRVYFREGEGDAEGSAEPAVSALEPQPETPSNYERVSRYERPPVV